MPTFEVSALFMDEWRALSYTQRAAVAEMRRQFVAALQRGGPLPAGLRVKGFKSRPGWYEIAWAGDGRALFSYGPEKIPGERHIIWHEIGTHAIYKQR